jgi:hypothetical protein
MLIARLAPAKGVQMATNQTPAKTKNQPQTTNGLSVAGFVCSLAGFLTGISFFVGLILSIIGLSQVKKTGQNGRGMALAGVIIGAIGSAGVIITTVIAVIVVVMAASSSINNVSLDCDWYSTYKNGRYSTEYRCQ